MTLVSRLLDLFLPTACAFCSSPVLDSGIPYFCSVCWSDFSIVPQPVCPGCGRPFGSPEALISSPDHRCISCRRDPPAFDQALSVGSFEGPLREAVHQFKYRPCRSLGKPLGFWMARNIRELSEFDLIIPVPLHRTRLHFRGFNQALLLADGLAACFSIRLCYDNLYRLRPTRPQVELSGADRIRNVAGAFALLRPGQVQHASILLVDDVFTTGATLNECAKVLKRAGAAEVKALTLARVI